MAELTEEEYAKTGVRLTTAKVLEQCELSYALMQELSGPLAAEKWTPARTAAFKKDRDSLKAKVAEASRARECSLGSTRGQTEVLATANAFRKQLVSRVNVVLPQKGLTKASFQIRGAINTTVPGMLDYLRRILPHVETLDGELTQYKGSTASEQLAATIQALEDADSTQESAIGAKAVDTREMNVLKGRLYLQLRKLGEVAKAAFLNKPATLRRFKLKLIARKVGAKKKKRATATQ